MTAEAPLLPRRTLVAALALALASFLLYAGSREFAFLNYDDPTYVAANPEVLGGLSAEGLGWAFTTVRAANWHPLTWLSLMLDVSLFGPDAGAMHLVNAGLHAATAAFFLCALAAATRRLGPSLFVAAFFALHPLRAESVAWISERKDLLAGLSWAAAMLAWAAHVARPSRGRYALVLACMALGLLAKPMLVTLPFALLLLDRWPFGRREPWSRLVLEKLPLVLLSVLSSLATLFAQRAGGALDGLLGLPLGARVANALAAIAAYVRQTLWPTDLAFFYPHPANFGEAGWSTESSVGLALVLGLAAAGFALRLRTPALLVGWLWFLGTLVPVLGIVQVGAQAHADRYTYVPGIGLGLLLAFGVDALCGERSGRRRAAALAGALWIGALLPLTLRQLATWRDSRSLMEHALAVTERNFLAHTNLAAALELEGESERAIEHYRTAVELRGDVTLVRYQLGRMLQARGLHEEAARHFRAGVEGRPEPRPGTAPEFHAARAGLGISLSILGRDAEAVPPLRATWTSTDARVEERRAAGQALAWLLATSADPDVVDGAEARAIAETLLEREETPALLESLAAAAARSGDYALAVRSMERALELIPERHHAGPLKRLELYRAKSPYVREP